MFLMMFLEGTLVLDYSRSEVFEALCNWPNCFNF